MTKNFSLLALSLVSCAVTLGCAHTSARVAPVPAAPVTAAAPAPAVPEVSHRQTQQDLDALARGAVIHFGFDEDALTPESQSRLTALAGALRATPGVTLRISGNCDERGTEEYNIALGQRRADVAKKFLVSLGVDDVRIATVSYGHERPLAEAHNEAAWSQNRRDDLAVLQDN